MQKSKSAPNAVSIRQCAAEIGIDPSQLTRESHQDGFPKSGAKVIVADVLAWRAENVRQYKPGRETSSVPPAIELKPTPVKALLSDDDPLLMAMRSGTATPVQMLEVAARMSGMEVADAYQSRSVPTTKFDALKKTLEELRKAKVAEIELQKSQAELIPRQVVRDIVAAAVARLVRVCGILENTIAVEAAMWRADPKVLAMSAEEFTQTVRGFTKKTTSEVRRLEAQGVESLIDAQIK